MLADAARGTARGQEKPQLITGKWQIVKNLHHKVTCLGTASRELQKYLSLTLTEVKNPLSFPNDSVNTCSMENPASLSYKVDSALSVQQIQTTGSFLNESITKITLGKFDLL